MDKTQFSSIDEYIKTFPPETRRALTEIRRTIRAAAPDAVEAISYQMPTFKLEGRNLVHFGGWKSHIGFYPIPSGLEAFAKELSKYKQGKGSVQFPLDEPMPLGLITKIVKYRVKEERAWLAARAGRAKGQGDEGMTLDNEPDRGGVEERAARPNGLSYIQIPAVDPIESARFYEAVFGWELRQLDTHPSFSDGTGHVIGAWSTERAVVREPGVLPYIYVTAIDETLAKATAQGAEIVREPYPEGALWVASIRDPAGNVIGVWQQGPR